MTGACLGIAVGLALAHGLWAALPIIALVSAVIGLLIVSIVPAAERPWVAFLVALAVCLRFAVAALIYSGSLAIGMGGFIGGDDSEYFVIAQGLSDWLRGQPQAHYLPPFWGGEAYLLGSFVYLEAALFLLLGPRVLLMELVNAGFAGMFIVLLFDLVRRIFDLPHAKLTAVVVAFFPSVVLWSAVNLKDSLALLLIAASLWLMLRLQGRPRWWLALATILVLIPIESTRRYIYVGLALILPIALAIAPRLAAAARMRWIAVASLATLVLIAMGSGSQGVPGVPAGGLAGLEAIRQAMGVGARTGFVDPKTVAVEQGQTYVIVDPASTSSPAPSPITAPTSSAATAEPTGGATPRVVYVPPGSVIVLENSASRPAPSVVYVRPGDIVVMGPVGSTAAPNATPQELTLSSRQGGDKAQTVAAGSSESLALTRTLSYIPKGIAYSLFAPFPWAIGRTADLLPVPEMLFWYLVLLVMPWSLWHERRHWREFATTLLFTGGVLGIFALTEGNFGTLYRHRAMVIPFGIALSSYGLLQLARAAQPRSLMERLRSWPR